MSDFETVQKSSVARKLVSASTAQPCFSCLSLSTSLQHKSLLYCHKARPAFISIFIISLTQSKCCEIPSQYIPLGCNGLNLIKDAGEAMSERFQLVHVCWECPISQGPAWRRIKGAQQCPDSSQHMGITMEKGVCSSPLFFFLPQMPYLKAFQAQKSSGITSTFSWGVKAWDFSNWTG